jgi:hypothetical protein
MKNSLFQGQNVLKNRDWITKKFQGYVMQWALSSHSILDNPQSQLPGFQAAGSAFIRLDRR